MAKGDVGIRHEGQLGLMDFPRDVTAQTRETAYSAYNGGPGSKCRWLKNTKWSRNDKGFWEKYTQRNWEKQLVAAK